MNLGTERFYKDIELMIGYKPHAIWHYMWKYVTPAVIFVSKWFFWLTNSNYEDLDTNVNSHN